MSGRQRQWLLTAGGGNSVLIRGQRQRVSVPFIPWSYYFRGSILGLARWCNHEACQHLHFLRIYEDLARYLKHWQMSIDVCAEYIDWLHHFLVWNHQCPWWKILWKVVDAVCSVTGKTFPTFEHIYSKCCYRKVAPIIKTPPPRTCCLLAAAIRKVQES